MELSMNVLSKPLSPLISAGLPNVTSSPALVSGPSALVAPDGLTTDLFGPAPVPAAPSASLAKAKGSPTRATFGQNGFGSSASAGLACSLASNLMRRSTGSILYRLIWKASVTPSGRLIYRLRASEARTSDNDLGLWPTPTTPSGGQSVPPGTTASGRRPDGSKATVTLEMVAKAAAWPTPTSTDANRGMGGDPFAPHMTLNMAANLASWATPAATDRPRSAETMEKCAAFRKRNANQNTVPLYLGDQVRLAAWSTPQVADAEWARVASATYTGLTGHALLTGSSAEIAAGARLNPAHARWLMRVPPLWDACAVTATRSTSRRSRTS
jgi:hypothetical protein